MEALRLRKEKLDLVHQAYQSLITNRFFDATLKWSECSNWICSQPEYLQYSELFGNDNARKLFERHIKSLKDQLANQKMQVYLKVLPQVLALLLDENFEEEVITTNQLNGRITNADLNLSTLWNLTKMALIEHPSFNQYFIINPNCSWKDASLLQKSNDINETMIPFDLLETPEAEQCFNEFRNSLKMNCKRLEMKQQFKQLLAETGYITAGEWLTLWQANLGHDFNSLNSYRNSKFEVQIEVEERHKLCARL